MSTDTDMTTDEVKLHDTALYLGDNGRCYCGEHSGMSARYTGRDISGQPVMLIDAAMLKEFGYTPQDFACEEPRCGRRPT